MYQVVSFFLELEDALYLAGLSSLASDTSITKQALSFFLLLPVLIRKLTINECDYIVERYYVEVLSKLGLVVLH